MRQFLIRCVFINSYYFCALRCDYMPYITEKMTKGILPHNEPQCSVILLGEGIVHFTREMHYKRTQNMFLQAIKCL